MATLSFIMTIVLVLVCIILIITVLLQEGKNAGLTSSITGSGETYWSKNRGRSKEGAVVKITKYMAIVFILIAIVLNIGFFK